MKLSTILKNGAVSLATMCVMNLYIIAYSSVAIFNPFSALLFLVASPFIYMMGKAAERNE